MRPLRVQGWDPVLIICQIISLQAIHYLVLAVMIPPLLTMFTSSSLLEYSGGPSTVSHIMDWRELASRPAVSSEFFSSRWGFRPGAWAGGKEIAHDAQVGQDMDMWDFGVDRTRGWLIGAAWVAASAFNIGSLYYIVRKPTQILDFALTLNLNHLILTTYYSGAFPLSIYYWLVQTAGAVVMIVGAEQLCVKREMQTDLNTTWSADEIELSERV